MNRTKIKKLIAISMDAEKTFLKSNYTSWFKKKKTKLTVCERIISQHGKSCLDMSQAQKDKYPHVQVWTLESLKGNLKVLN